MKETGNNMDCVACGKPISITAKFCGKCGAPVKRSDPVGNDTALNEREIKATHIDAAPEEMTEQPIPPSPAPNNSPQHSSSHEIDDLALTMELPSDAEHASMLKIDLNLSDENVPSGDTSDIKQMLEKQTHLLDFISLASQQLTHLQSQPSPLEPLLREILAAQHALSAKLGTLKESVDQPQPEVSMRMPDEFRLLLEKQKIELLKAFSQNVAQNTANIEAVYKDTTTKIDSLIQANAATAQAMEKNMAPITQTVTDMKTRLQAVSKKIEEVSAPTKKTSSASNNDGTEGGGGFILFIIGLLCGLTVVLSSLAIYNFLSHEVHSTAKAAHDEASADHDKPSTGHDDAAPAAHDTTNQDKPANDSGKSNSH